MKTNALLLTLSAIFLSTGIGAAGEPPNLLENGSFEVIAGQYTVKKPYSEGNIPTPWKTTKPIGGDAYTALGEVPSGQPADDTRWGFPKNHNQHFLDIPNFLPLKAADGNGWVAGCSICGPEPEFIWQELPSTTHLKKGLRYRVTAQLLQADSHPRAGTYDIFLAESVVDNKISDKKFYFGRLWPPTSTFLYWHEAAAEKMITEDVSSLKQIVFVPVCVASSDCGPLKGVYPGLDDVKLTIDFKPSDIARFLPIYPFTFIPNDISSLVIGGHAGGPSIVIPIGGGIPVVNPPQNPAFQDALTALFMSQAAGQLSDTNARMRMQIEALRVAKDGVERLERELGAGQTKQR